MSALVVEQSIACLVPASGREGVTVVSRERCRGRSWKGLEGDRVVAALDESGAGSLVLVRDPEADCGARVLGEIARLMGHATVRLPATPAEAAWAVAVAAHREFQGEGLLRRLESLVGEMGRGGPLPRRLLGPGVRVPALRPAALARWAGCAWRACRRCPGGGPVGGCCARCGARP